jgi:BRO family, N-terminal domain
MTENTKQDCGLNGKDPSGPHAEDVGPGLPEREQPHQSVFPVGEYAFNGCRIQPVLLNGEPWFIAAEVCAALEHSDTSKAVSRLDEDEKGAATVRTLGGSQEMLVVSESGLYALIFSSRKPVARAFRKWVTQEVLPSIRKTGRYERDQPPPLGEHYVREEIPVTLPGHGRWVVTTRPGHPPHIYRTDYDTVVQDVADADCRFSRIISC